MSEPTDCLVLKIDEFYEFEPNVNKKDTTLFILYDKMLEEFIIRGKRINSSYNYSFTCKKSKDIAFFIELILGEGALWSYNLYSFDGLPIDQNDITFGYLKNITTNCSSNDIITGYDNQDYNKKKLRKIIKMLKNVFNYY